MSKPIKLREPGKRVFKPKPKLTLIKPVTERKPMPPLDDEIRKLLDEMRRRETNRHDEAPDAA